MEEQQINSTIIQGIFLKENKNIISTLLFLLSKISNVFFIYII